jgi:transcriptional regulator with XRE-family HTH domain
VPRPLKEVRQERGIGVRRLSKGAPVSPRTLITTEKGDSTPTPETIRKISRFLGVDPMEISEFKAALEEQGLAGLPEEPAPTLGPTTRVPGEDERTLEDLVELMRDIGRWQTREAFRRAFGSEPPA